METRQVNYTTTANQVKGLIRKNSKPFRGGGGDALPPGGTDGEADGSLTPEGLFVLREAGGEPEVPPAFQTESETEPWMSPDGFEGWLPFSWPGRKDRIARRVVSGYLERIATDGMNGVVSGYLERCANRSGLFSPSLDVGLDGLHPPCGGWGTVGVCEHGHRYAKVLLCGLDWCPTCGQVGSDAHKRRWSRLWPKVAQLPVLGKWVITLPMEIREKFLTKEALNVLDRGFQTILRNFGFKRGISRWHWFGDKHPDVVHQHWNACTDGGMIETKKLAEIREAVRSFLKSDRVVMQYRYVSKTAQVVHWLKYMTRPTFTKLTGFEWLAMELKGFRNVKWWGSGLWNDEPAHVLAGDEETPAIAAIENGICPECFTPITWTGEIVHGRNLECQEIGGGYYKLKTMYRRETVDTPS